MMKTKNETKDRNAKRPLLFLSCAAAILFIVITGIVRCPFDLFLGIPCPLCGITRAFLALSRGEIASSFYYHPLWPLIALSLLLWILKTANVIRPSKKTADTVCIILAFLLLACRIIRHLQGSPVTEIHFESSLLGRWLF